MLHDTGTELKSHQTELWGKLISKENEAKTRKPKRKGAFDLEPKLKVKVGSLGLQPVRCSSFRSQSKEVPPASDWIWTLSLQRELVLKKSHVLEMVDELESYWKVWKEKLSHRLGQKVLMKRHQVLLELCHICRPNFSSTP